MRVLFDTGRSLGVQGCHDQYQSEKERLEVRGCLAVEIRSA